LLRTKVRAPLARGWQNFANEPDTDFALPQNGEWAQQIIATSEPLHGANAIQIPLVIAGQDSGAGVPPASEGVSPSKSNAGETPTVTGETPAPLPDHAPVLHSFSDGGSRITHHCSDPSRPGLVIAHYPHATAADIARAVECAAADPDEWRTMPVRARYDLLGQVAQEIREARAELLGAALANGGKTLPESDPEVSEAVDFLEFYRDTARWWQEMTTLEARPKGVVVVVSPWNFPISIPCGGVAAALAAGNTVILKPSSDTVLIAWELCQCFWRAGVSKNALQFLPCSGGKEGRSLVNHPKVNAVILTGGTQTALSMLRDNPRLSLFAETGGKNATIVTALSDREQAIKHVLHSAFSHAGQKCSATSLLLLQDEVYDDPNFRRSLCEAAQSIRVGSAWQLDTKMGPLIRPPSGVLETGLKVLDPGEEWALMPQPLEGNPNLWTPGIKYGVRPGSFTHLTELFGPVLAVMRFEKLSEAIALANQTGYGLTSGLESLDEREWDYWKSHLNAGNLYINRVTTGAVVLRQPFGGFGKSSFGPGMKAGSPNYVAQFMEFRDLPDAGGNLKSEIRNPKSDATDDAPRFTLRAPRHTHLCDYLLSHAHPDADRITAAAGSYECAWHDEFSKAHDHFRLVGQDNFRRYLALHSVRIRLHADDTPFDLFARACAGYTVGSRAIISVPPGLESPALALLEELTEPWAGAIEFVEEADEELAEAMRNGQTDRVRYAAPDRVPLLILQASAETGICVVSAPVSTEGRLELLWYLREQSLSIDYHRYGNLGARASEPRAPVR
jgi:RHH-type proline utilization regulon transcriptional repressor/proline dehydrogenase/delta 1-pyrroline-5-carboxylate dehydrogenase